MSKQPTDTDYAEPVTEAGRRRRTARRAQGLLALALSVAVVGGGLFGVNRILADDGRNSSPDAASTASPPPATVVVGPLDVSGSGVGAQPFGTDIDGVMAALKVRFGEPDQTLGPQHYFRIPGHDGWYADATDAWSPSWQYPVASLSCWGVFCVVFGGDGTENLQLRGWELAQYRSWSGEELADLLSPDVRLSRTGIRLGDGWAKLHAAYPGAVPGGGEGNAVVVNNTPWPGWHDGIAGWRLSGGWDYTHPTKAPAGAVVTRLSGGEGPQPGWL